MLSDSVIFKLGMRMSIGVTYCTGNRTGTCGVLLVLGLVLSLLPIMLRAEHLIAENRLLRVQDGSTLRQYTVPELVAAIELTELQVPNDPHFGPNRLFTGFRLEPLLDHIGLGDASELLLVCADGYSIPLDVSTLLKPPLSSLLAIRDTALPEDGEAHWQVFRHGAEIVNFDPFYLVWASTDERVDLGTEALPWPFQVTEIQRFDRSTYYVPAQPSVGASEAAKNGFALYTAHCGKCHRMRGVGGDVGPVLDRENSLSSIFTKEQLSAYVRHDESRFPQSRMPQYSELLRDTEIDQIVSYLRAMQTKESIND